MTDIVTQQQEAEKSDVFDPMQTVHVTPIPAYGLRVNEPVPVTGLPVAGYKKTQPPHLIALVNENKVLEEKILRQIERHKLRGNELDQRAIAIAFTTIQEAFMWLNRGVFQPGRLEGDLD